MAARTFARRGSELNDNQALIAPSRGQIYKVAVASIVGSIIEQYDFLVTGVIAATIWGDVFFKLPKLAAAAAAISIYGIGIIIRPIGAFLFGHLADRHGRKDALVYALLLMGISTLLIGLTPGYDTIGVTAPAFLILFRLVQGISFGAEFGTASTWVAATRSTAPFRTGLALTRSEGRRSMARRPTASSISATASCNGAPRRKSMAKQLKRPVR